MSHPPSLPLPARRDSPRRDWDGGEPRRGVARGGAWLARPGRAWLLPLILLAALGLRLRGIDFGLPALNDPDELMFELGAVRMLRGPTLNPGWFGHPATTTMYALAIVDVLVFATGFLLGRFSSVRAFADAIYADPSWVILPGRIMIAFFAVATVWLTYRLGRELFDRRAGLAAAALLAASPVHITWSQVIRSDIMACFFMVLTLLAALRIARQDRERDHVLASLWIGLAVATKWPFALSALAVAGALAWRWRSGMIDGRKALVRLAQIGTMSLGFLLVISPYLLIDFDTVLRNLAGEAQQRHLGSTGGAPWENLRWYLQGPISSGLGAAGLALLAAGSVLFVRRREAAAVIAPTALGFVLLICVQRLVWERWALPLLPLFALISALGAIGLYDLVRRRSKPLASVLLAGVLAASLAPLAITAEANARERTNDTRQRAASWARAHIPPGSSVLVEHFAFDLLDQPWRFLFPLGEAGCVDARAWLQGKVGYAPIEASRGSRTNVDYGTLAPNRRDSCRADYAILTQYDRYRLERSAFPAEYQAYELLLRRGRIVASFAPEPGRSGGRLVRIVRFKPGR